MRSDRMSPLPGPGVFATSSSNATPALLPDGSIAPGSVSQLVERSESVRVVDRNAQGRSLAAIETADHPQRGDAAYPRTGPADMGAPLAGHSQGVDA
jgi:NADH-quinone oxidoreductase subunit J